MDEIVHKIEINGRLFEYRPDVDDIRYGSLLAEMKHQEERRMEEREELEILIAEREAGEERRKYAVFLKDAEGLRNPGAIRGVLIKHFPHRFGSKGVQPLSDYDEDRLYGVYQGVLSHARKVVGRVLLSQKVIK